MKEYKDNLKKLCLTPGVSSNEIYSGISQKIFSLAKRINPDTFIDKLGNVVSVIGEGKNALIIDSHLDEVGFLISKVNGESAKIMPIGDILPQRINNSEAFIINKNIKGTILQDAGNMIFIPRDKRKQKEIEPGDILSFARIFELEGKSVKATALDNRVGCACLLEVMKDKAKIKDIKIVFTFTSREEQDNSILDIIALKYKAKFGIIIDAAYAKPVVFGTDNMMIPTAGNGCAIQHIGTGFMVDKKIIDIIEKQAQKEKIKYQKEIPLPELGRTNFPKLIKAGIQGCVINIPVKNQHTQTSEMVIDDVSSTLDMIFMLIRMFKKGTLGSVD